MADAGNFPEYSLFWFDSLLRAERSVDPRFDDYELRRNFTITIYVHNDEEKVREEGVFNDVVGILRTRARNYGLIIYESGPGPFEGSVRRCSARPMTASSAARSGSVSRNWRRTAPRR
jgi:hypothetical protein